MDPAKLHPRLQAVLEARTREVAAAEVEERLPVIVRLRADTRALTAGTLRARRHYSLIPAVAGEASPQEIEALTDDPAVEMVWLDEEVHTCLDVSVPLIQAPRVWDAGFTGEGITIAVVDTGIDPNHPDLAGRVANMTDFTSEGPEDNNGHGTHVAGIAAGSGAASEGRFRGVAPGATLISAKVLRGSGFGRMSDVMAGVEWAVQQGAHVINLSLGGSGPCDGTDALSVTCDAAVEHGVVVCVAAGNDGPASQTVGSPGCARRVITVGASDDEDRVADFSSRGPTGDGRVKPDVVFPGVGIVAPRAAGTSMGTPLNDHYTQASGTSMATPHAAGTAALLLQANPNLTPEEVKRIFQEAAVDLHLDPNVQGTGRVDAFRAYQAAVGAQPPVPEPTPPPEPTPEPTPTPTPEPQPQPPGCLGQLLRTLGIGR